MHVGLAEERSEEINVQYGRRLIKIKTREKKYTDYGFSMEEAKRLKEYCSSARFTEHKLLMECAIASNPSIAPELCFSIVRGISYDELLKIKHIPLPKADFYGYQRKCLAIFKERSDYS